MAEDRVKRNARLRRWRLKHPQRSKALDRAYRVRNHDKIRARERENYAKNPIKHRATSLQLHYRIKERVFARYGGYVCACCGETEKKFLTIDHIDNSGAQHRKTIGRGRLYRWIYSNGFPPGFQVLCWNCNMGKYQNGGICPHKRQGGRIERGERNWVSNASSDQLDLWQ